MPFAFDSAFCILLSLDLFLLLHYLKNIDSKSCPELACLWNLLRSLLRNLFRNLRNLLWNLLRCSGTYRTCSGTCSRITSEAPKRRVRVQLNGFKTDCNTRQFLPPTVQLGSTIPESCQKLPSKSGQQVYSESGL